VRLTTVLTPAGPRAGVLDGEVIRLLEPGVTLVDVVRAGPEGLAAVHRAVRSGSAIPLDEAEFGPLLSPPSVRDFSVYERHIHALAGEVPNTWYEEPLFYFSNPAAIVAPYGSVAIPPGVRQLDYELEVAAVVGAAGSDLTPEQAADHIFGYTIMNDWSARDLQVREFTLPFGPSKSKDAATTLGPWLVTADELADHVEDGRLALRTEVRLNGVITGSDTTASMSWSFPDLVAYASRGTVVQPGDVLGSGTCGTGCLAEIRRTRGADAPDWLAPGDVVRIEVEGLGHIENRLVAGPDPVPIPAARRRITAPTG